MKMMERKAYAAFGETAFGEMGFGETGRHPPIPPVKTPLEGSACA